MSDKYLSCTKDEFTSWMKSHGAYSNHAEAAYNALHQQNRNFPEYSTPIYRESPVRVVESLPVSYGTEPKISNIVEKTNTTSSQDPIATSVPEQAHKCNCSEGVLKVKADLEKVIADLNRKFENLLGDRDRSFKTMLERVDQHGEFISALKEKMADVDQVKSEVRTISSKISAIETDVKDIKKVLQNTVKKQDEFKMDTVIISSKISKIEKDVQENLQSTVMNEKCLRALEKKEEENRKLLQNIVDIMISLSKILKKT